MSNVLIINTEKPLSERHLCYFTRDSLESEKITLMEVVEQTFPHPDAPELANITKIDYRSVKEFHRRTFNGANCVLLEAAQMAVELQMNS